MIRNSGGLLLTLAILSGSAFAAHPKPRTYITHDYFNLELAPGSTWEQAEAVSCDLGAELVERIGELDGHWLLRAGKEELGRRSADPGDFGVVEKWKTLRSQRRSTAKAAESLSSRATTVSGTTSTIRNLSHLPLRQRSKRVYPSYSPLAPSNHTTSFDRRDDAYLTELKYAQNDLHLADPMIPEQWHLINTDMPEIEMNVTGLWGRGITGDNVKVCLVDDGLDMHSDDLAANFYAEGSYDFNDHTPLPEPRLSDDNHGTRCAGEIAAVPNDVCGVGVAYTAKVAGVRILSGPISDADEAAALNYEYQNNEIYSCSWGPPDDGRSMDAPDGLILKALVNGVQNGRNGKGSIFVFAAGNGGGMDDQCNFDGYTNSIFSVTIGAVDRKGLHPYYSELCAAMLAVAPSSGSGDHIHTTDVGKDKCSAGHGGTSAAAPLAVGMIALALQVRQDLTWRDVQHLMVRHSVYFNPDDPDWEKTAAGRQFSYKYGYGRVDAGLLVEAAEAWTLVKPQAWFDSPAVILPETAAPASISDRQEEVEPVEVVEPTAPDGTDETESETIPEVEADPAPPSKPSGSFITEEGVQSTFSISQQMLDDLNFETLEHITVRLWAEHDRRGDVEVELLSPNGVISVLARQRRYDDATSGFNGWKFMSVKHWDENPLGTWTITVKDRINPDKIGYFKQWSLQLWGQVIDPSKAKIWSLPDSDITDEEQIGSDPTVSQPTQKPKPTDHLPDDHGSAEGEAHKPGLAEPVGTPAQDEDDATLPDLADADEGIFSGIETLKANSKWIGGAASLLIIVGIGAGLFFVIRARRKKSMFGQLGGERGSYRPVSEDMPMGLLDRSKQKLLGKRDNGSSKDLYDAFAYEQSEDEDDGLGEAEQLGYHDRFLDDEDEPKTGYSDAPNAEESGMAKSEEKADKSPEGSSSGSSSWQDTTVPSPGVVSPR